MKKITAFLLSLLMLLGVFAPATATTVQAKASENIKATYTLKKNKKKIAKKTITLKKNATVTDGLKKGWKVNDKGGFITAIDGHKQNNKKKIYWTFTVNGKQVNVSADKKKLHNKDKVVFKLSKAKASKNIKATYTLKKNKKKIAKKTITLKKNATVTDGLKKGWKVNDKGGFITAIDGHKQNNKKKIYWTFTVNGKQVNVSADKKKLHNKDKVVFKLSKYNG
ncbi:DUF4430 domain-containing protein [Companilactobacillus futsaii]|uniref:DUF4430 domain-containing protein n=3 Tax=Companilactobacillus TaxID=2767879 RepID=UPI0018A6F373|nr:DUF4430 domain-containing protein [Companilactobacillus futsaii]